MSTGKIVQIQKLFYCILGFSTIVCSADAFELPRAVKIHNEYDIYQLREDELITEELAETLLELLENPIELNRADVDELLSLPGITQTEAEAVVEQRKKLRGFKRWNDLLRVVGFDREKLKQLEAFAYIRPPLDRFDGKYELNLSQIAGDSKSYYSRMRIRADVDERIFFGLSTRREDDETYRWNEKIVANPPGWRLDKFYAIWRGEGLVNQVILGNYSAGFGSGLVFNDAHRLVPRGLYSDDTISPYRQRGVALGLSWKAMQQNMFFSQSNYPTVLSSKITGLRWQRRIFDVYSERLIGTDISFKLPHNSTLGFTWYHSFIDKNLDIQFTNLPNKERWGAYGLHFNTSVGGFYLRGEASQTIDSSRALYLELSTKLKSANLLASFRRYDVDFDNPHSYGFADADDSRQGDIDGDIDEIGVYMRLQYRPNRKFSLRTYYNQWRHPSTHTMDNKAYTEVEYRFSKMIEIGISGKWDDDDLSAHGNERFGSLLWMRTNPYKDLHLTTVYRLFQIHKNALSYDDYAYLKLEWDIQKWLELEARWKMSDTKLTDGDTFPKEGYLQFQIWNRRGFGGRIRYIRKHYGSASRVSPNPKHSLFLRLEYRW